MGGQWKRLVEDRMMKWSRMHLIKGRAVPGTPKDLDGKIRGSRVDLTAQIILMTWLHQRAVL